jgi:hypothetical protein
MAKLLSGTRIYGTANVDTQIYVGSNVSINTTGFSVTGNATTIPTLSFYSNATAGVLTIGNSTSTSLPTMSLANSTGNVTVTPISVAVGTAATVNTTGIYHTGTINAASHTTGATGTGTGGISANVTTLWVGNNTINTTITSAGLTVNGTAVVANSTGVWTTGTVNAASHTVGAIFVANTITLNANGLVVNSTGAYVTGLVNATSFTVSTSTIANSLGVYTATVNATTHSAGANVGFTNNSFLFTGNTTTSPTITLANTGAFSIGNSSTTQTAATITVANSAGNVQITAGAVSINATGSINSSSIAVGTGFVANSTRVTIAGIPLTSNGSNGTSGQVLTSNGSTGAPYWAAAGFTNGQSISVANLAITGSLTANGSVGTSGYVLISNGSTGSPYWAANPFSVRQQFTANGTQNTFTVTGGYSANNLDVYLNGVKLYNGTEANVQNGSTFTIITGNPANGSLIEVVGGTSTAVGGATGSSGDQVFFVSSQNVTSSYTIAAGKSAMTIGPTNLANGVVITISSGSRWVIL